MKEPEWMMGRDGLRYCRVCGLRTERFIDFPRMDGTHATDKMKVHVMCKCEQEEQLKKEQKRKFEDEMQKVEELRRLSLMDANLKRANFSTFRVEKENERLFRIARNYVEYFPKMYEENQGLLLYGNVGTGKSYTAAVIANELINRQYTVIMTSFVKLLQDVTKFDSDNEQYVKRLSTVKLLVIDDLGAERGTDYALEQVYNFIDSRYRSGKPVILTTNLELSDMKECTDIRYNRIYDRIFEMCYPVKVDGLSWRKREAANRFRETRAILEG